MKRSAPFYKSEESATCSSAFAEFVANTYTFIAPTPDMSLAEIMYEAGKQEVVNWVKSNVRNSIQDNKINREII